jgi:Putative Ig domain
MKEYGRDAVRAFLPLVALAFCPGCGGGDDSAATPAAPPAAVNQAPTISGSAASRARVGVAYVYQPKASDADGDPLTFSAENLPPWAHFDSTSGRITGTPQAGDIGEYESIRVAVADAAHKAETNPFSIVVTDAVTVATLKWEKPASKVDGSPLDDLAGYRIVYGRTADDLDSSVFVDDPDQTSYEFSDLASGVWFFAVIGVSSSGLEGPPTIPAEKSI